MLKRLLRSWALRAAIFLAIASLPIAAVYGWTVGRYCEMAAAVVFITAIVADSFGS